MVQCTIPIRFSCIVYCTLTCPWLHSVYMCTFPSAQAFHGAFESFLTWLRKTERKVQRDDPLKLEEEDLEAGLKNLKVGGRGRGLGHENGDAICRRE